MQEETLPKWSWDGGFQESKAMQELPRGACEENGRKEAFAWKNSSSPVPSGACQSAQPEVRLLWSAGVWGLLSPSVMIPWFPWQRKNTDNWKMNACSATKQDLLSYHRFYAKYAERIRIARRPLLLLLIVIKTWNTQRVAAIFLFQFTDKIGASVLLMVTERLFTCLPTLTPFRASSYRSVYKNETKGATCECLVKKPRSLQTRVPHSPLINSADIPALWERGGNHFLSLHSVFPPKTTC